MADELCTFYEDEGDRKTAFWKLLGEFFNAEIPKKIGGYITDGAVMYKIVENDGASRLLIESNLNSVAVAIRLSGSHCIISKTPVSSVHMQWLMWAKKQQLG